MPKQSEFIISQKSLKITEYFIWGWLICCLGTAIIYEEWYSRKSHITVFIFRGVLVAVVWWVIVNRSNLWPAGHMQPSTARTEALPLSHDVMAGDLPFPVQLWACISFTKTRTNIPPALCFCCFIFLCFNKKILKKKRCFVTYTHYMYYIFYVLPKRIPIH